MPDLLAGPHGQIRPWSYDDVETFPLERCAACYGTLLLDQEVQERPALSLHVYHTKPRDCAALR